MKEMYVKPEMIVTHFDEDEVYTNVVSGSNPSTGQNENSTDLSGGIVGF